eukprot:m.22275 g.22275  ORF g.22275 m.22275 type:complete len:79 (+) comp11226_c0_seq2:2176-2412(+)
MAFGRIPSQSAERQEVCSTGAKHIDLYNQRACSPLPCIVLCNGLICVPLDAENHDLLMAAILKSIFSISCFGATTSAL